MSLPEDVVEKMVALIREYRDIFTLMQEEMPCVDPEVAIHRLNVDPADKPIQEKLRPFNSEKTEIIRLEIDQLLKAGT